MDHRCQLVRPPGTGKSCQASISSKPLFIKVALSTEILAPMNQFGVRPPPGWASPSPSVRASSLGTDRRSRSARHGPRAPAGRSRSIARWPSAPNRRAATWLHSADSDRATVHRAHTSASLLASAMRAPCPAAAHTGGKPALPTIAATTHSTGRVAASIRASRPDATPTPLPSRASTRAAWAPFVGDHRKVGWNSVARRRPGQPRLDGPSPCRPSNAPDRSARTFRVETGPRTRSPPGW